MKNYFSLTLLSLLMTFGLNAQETDLISMAYNRSTRKTNLVSVKVSSGEITKVQNKNYSVNTMFSQHYNSTSKDLILSTSTFDNYQKIFQSHRIIIVDTETGNDVRIKTGRDYGVATSDGNANIINVFSEEAGFVGTGGKGVVFSKVNTSNNSNSDIRNYGSSLRNISEAFYVPGKDVCLIVCEYNNQNSLLEIDANNGRILRDLTGSLSRISTSTPLRVATNTGNDVVYIGGMSSNGNSINFVSLNLATSNERLIFSKTPDQNEKVDDLDFDLANNRLVIASQRGSTFTPDRALHTINVQNGTYSEITQLEENAIFEFSIYSSQGGDPDPDPDPDPDTSDVAVELSITLDNYPQETSWRIVSDNGQAVASSDGTYASQPDGTTVIEKLSLTSGCYTLELLDSYGDGICCSYGNGSYELTDSSGVLASGGSFTRVDSKNFCVGNNRRVAGNNKFNTSLSLDRFQVFPTVASQELNIAYATKETADLNITMLDISGRVIESKSYDGNDSKGTIRFDVSALSTGTYFLKISENGRINATKFLVRR